MSMPLQMLDEGPSSSCDRRFSASKTRSSGIPVGWIAIYGSRDSLIFCSTEALLLDSPRPWRLFVMAFDKALRR